MDEKSNYIFKSTKISGTSQQCCIPLLRNRSRWKTPKMVSYSLSGKRESRDPSPISKDDIYTLNPAFEHTSDAVVANGFSSSATVKILGFKKGVNEVLSNRFRGCGISGDVDHARHSCLESF